MSSRERPLHFLHIGKTGGTAIKHALGPLAATGNPKLHPHRVRLSDIPAGEDVFFVLRDPLARFTSAFYSRKREGQPRYFVPWSPDEAAAFGRFATPDELASALSSQSAAARRKAEQAMRVIPHVNSRYWSWLVGAEYLASRAEDVRFIGLQESLTADFAALRGLLRIPDSVQLPDDDTDAHRNPVSVDRTLGAQAVRNLSAWYREDYAALRQCRRLAQERQLGGSICAAAWIDAEPRAQ
jgi:hypothetical protein